MKLRMAENSLFAVLLRSAWWASALLALGIVVVSHALLPPQYAWIGASGALPFAVISAMAGWRQMRRPSAAQVQATRDALAAMSWERLAAALVGGFERQGHRVERIPGPGADLVLHQGGRSTLVACRRWKAARTGVEPLRELAALRDAREARAATYVALHPLSEQAAAFAAAEGIAVMGPAELASLLAGIDLGR